MDRCPVCRQPKRGGEDFHHYSWCLPRFRADHAIAERARELMAHENIQARGWETSDDVLAVVRYINHVGSK